MKRYTHDYSKPSEAESVLYSATRLMANESYDHALERINEARTILQQYLAQDNMIVDDEVEGGYVRAQDITWFFEEPVVLNKNNAMTNSIDRLAGNILNSLSVLSRFALDAENGQLDNIEQLGSRVDLAMEAIQALHGFVGQIEQELMATIDHARAL